MRSIESLLGCLGTLGTLSELGALCALLCSFCASYESVLKSNVSIRGVQSVFWLSLTSPTGIGIGPARAVEMEKEAMVATMYLNCILEEAGLNKA